MRFSQLLLTYIGLVSVKTSALTQQCSMTVAQASALNDNIKQSQNIMRQTTPQCFFPDGTLRGIDECYIEGVLDPCAATPSLKVLHLNVDIACTENLKNFRTRAEGVCIPEQCSIADLNEVYNLAGNQCTFTHRNDCESSIFDIARHSFLTGEVVKSTALPVCFDGNGNFRSDIAECAKVFEESERYACNQLGGFRVHTSSASNIECNRNSHGLNFLSSGSNLCLPTECADEATLKEYVESLNFCTYESSSDMVTGPCLHTHEQLADKRINEERAFSEIRQCFSQDGTLYETDECLQLYNGAVLWACENTNGLNALNVNANIQCSGNDVYSNYESTNEHVCVPDQCTRSDLAELYLSTDSCGIAAGSSELHSCESHLDEIAAHLSLTREEVMKTAPSCLDTSGNYVSSEQCEIIRQASARTACTKSDGFTIHTSTAESIACAGDHGLIFLGGKDICVPNSCLDEALVQEYVDSLETCAYDPSSAAKSGPLVASAGAVAVLTSVFAFFV